MGREATTIIFSALDQGMIVLGEKEMFASAVSAVQMGDEIRIALDCPKPVIPFRETAQSSLDGDSLLGKRPFGLSEEFENAIFDSPLAKKGLVKQETVVLQAYDTLHRALDLLGVRRSVPDRK